MITDPIPDCVAAAMDAEPGPLPDAVAAAWDTELDPPPVRWAPEVLVEGKWSRNQLRFATEAEASAYARDLMWRWTSVDDYRATEATEPVNYAYADGKLEPLQ